MTIQRLSISYILFYLSDTYLHKDYDYNNYWFLLVQMLLCASVLLLPAFDWEKHLWYDLYDKEYYGNEKSQVIIHP